MDVETSVVISNDSCGRLEKVLLFKREGHHDMMSFVQQHANICSLQSINIYNAELLVPYPRPCIHITDPLNTTCIITAFPSTVAAAALPHCHKLPSS